MLFLPFCNLIFSFVFYQVVHCTVRIMFLNLPQMSIFITLYSYNSKLAGLLSEKLAACINVIPGVTSYYEWQGKMEEDEEV